MNCSKCGFTNSDQNIFCIKCGFRLDSISVKFEASKEAITETEVDIKNQKLNSGSDIVLLFFVIYLAISEMINYYITSSDLHWSISELNRNIIFTLNIVRALSFILVSFAINGRGLRIVAVLISLLLSAYYIYQNVLWLGQS
jgi:hypothetical protein